MFGWHEAAWMTIGFGLASCIYVPVWFWDWQLERKAWQRVEEDMRSQQRIIKELMKS